VYAGAGLFVLWLGRAAYVVANGEPRGLLADLDSGCRDTGFSCGVLSGTVTSVLTISFATALFLFLRFRQVKRRYRRRARTQAEELVQAGKTHFPEIVGRDELCKVLIDDLRDRNGRRPHVVVGGVGTGKTAVMVRLTEMLAARRAVPVPVRLRDAGNRLNFRELAREAFINSAQRVVLSDQDAERVWRQLCKEDRIVVLADGLEEALSDGPAEIERDSLIRIAIREAAERRLPLVITSRPHDPLRGMDAAIVELEPLSEEAALQFVQAKVRGDDRRIDWIIETAEVVETPLYLRIARELHEAELLGQVVPGGEDDEDGLDTRGMDRVELRLRLMQAWVRALERGHFEKEQPLHPRDRKAAVKQLSALACVGLKQDSLDVKFSDLVGAPPPPVPPKRVSRPAAAPVAAGSAATGSANPAGNGDHASILGLALQRRPRRRPAEPPYPELYDAVKEERWSRMDPRLAAAIGLRLGLVESHGDGVRFPHSIMQAYLGSRMIGAALKSRAYCEEALNAPGREFLVSLVLYACEEANRRRSGKEPQTPGGATPHELAELLRRFGRDEPEEAKALDLFAAALEIDSVDPDPQQVRVARALTERWEKIATVDRTVEEAKLGTVRRFGEAARKVADRRSHAEPAYLELFDIGCIDRSYRVRLSVAQELGAGSDRAFEALEEHLGAPEPPPDGADLERLRRKETMRAWLAPLLAGSVRQSGNREKAQKQLDGWLSRIGDERVREPGTRPLPLALEAALAQGFKHAANRRRRHPHARSDMRDYLAEQAREMLKRARFWYSRLTLVHALCLWTLPDDADASQDAHDDDNDALVRHWLALPDSRLEHPFVAEARALAVRALETGRPERYLWIDESGVVTRVGSLPAKRTELRKHQLWIPPSTGWTALDPSAQQLVADVLLLLNLAERGDSPGLRDQRFARADREDLPPCLSGRRTPLDPGRTVGAAESSSPGSSCKKGCPFELCPYPPKGDEAYRVEIGEAFCRRQQTLVRNYVVRSHAAPWQKTNVKELKTFWGNMGVRARR
jgi:hypothetical protein